MIPILPDRNVGPAAYATLAQENKLLVSNIFYTFQGEGPYTGQPALFIRLAGCNLGDKKACPFCDADFLYDKGTVLEAEKIKEHTQPHWARVGNGGLIVVTGGEPLLQTKALVAAMLHAEDDNATSFTWQFETNGVFLTDALLKQLRRLSFSFTFVVSPKIIGGKYQTLPELQTDPGEVVFKYVVSADPTSPYHRLPEGLPTAQLIYVSGQTEYGPEDELSHPGHPVNLFGMSEAARKHTAANWAYAAKLALERGYGYRVSFQTHLLAGVE